jgi:hypothetical protein
LKSLIKYFITILIFITAEFYAQEPEPKSILENVQKQFSTINDYTVDATISVDVDFLRVPEAHAKIYFKQPDKVRMMSEGFALIPKQGLSFSPAKLLNEDFTAIYVKSDSLDHSSVEVIKVIPSADSLDIILMTLWVDTTHNVIRQVESTTKNAGTVLMELKYDFGKNEILPQEVIFSFNLSNFNLPASFTGQFNKSAEETAENEMSEIKGIVSIRYANYLINTGIPDSVFTK